MPKGKNKGVHIGRITTRLRPSFGVGQVDDIHPKYIMLLQRNDGYEYHYNPDVNSVVRVYPKEITNIIYTEEM